MALLWYVAFGLGQLIASILRLNEIEPLGLQLVEKGIKIWSITKDTI